MSEEIRYLMLCVGGPADGSWRSAIPKHGETFVEIVMPPIEDVPLDGNVGATVNAVKHVYEVVEWNFGAWPTRHSYYLLKAPGLRETDLLNKLIEGYRRP